MNDAIVISVALNSEQVKMLVSFLNSTEDEAMGRFVDGLLKTINKETLIRQKNIVNVMKENPYSQKYLEKGIK